MADPTLLELVANKTIDEHIAALLWTAAEEKRWLITVAGPRKAGKSVILNAALQFVPPGTAVHSLSGEHDEIRQIGEQPDGGYLEVGEISKGPPSRYIWGEPVRSLFTSLNSGFSLATTMHGTGVDDVFEQICRDNEITDADASKIQYVFHIERFGEEEEDYWRRVTGAYEIHGVVDGKPKTRLLHRWLPDDDRFERVDSPGLLAASADTLKERAGRIRKLVAAGRTSPDDSKTLAHPAG